MRAFFQTSASNSASAGANRYINDLAVAAPRVSALLPGSLSAALRWESCLVCRKDLFKASLESLEKLDQCVLIFIAQRRLQRKVTGAKIVATIDNVVRAFAQGE